MGFDRGLGQGEAGGDLGVGPTREGVRQGLLDDSVDGCEPLPPDVVIGGWAWPWNLRGARSVSGAPPSALWATAPAGFGQIGCVYTAQGFEYGWSGVIIGPDLVWRGDRWVTDRTASKDPVFKKSTPDTDVDRLIRNTYKVLPTRGMVGTIVYSTDPETREKLRELVSGRREPRSAAVEEPFLRR